MEKNNNNSFNPKIAAIVQVRLASTRLPKKPLMDIIGKPILWHVINRLRLAKKINEIVIAIPDTKENDILEEFAQRNKVKYFRGSEKDVLSRYYGAAKKFKVDIIVRITSDCPLIDAEIIDLVIEKHLKLGADYTSNVQKRTFPKGLDIEIFNFNILENVYREAKNDSDREHVTLYIRKHPEIFRCVNVENNKDFSRMRWTVDEIKDLEFVREVYKKLYKKEKVFLMEEIVKLLKKCPKLLEINKNIKRKKI